MSKTAASEAKGFPRKVAVLGAGLMGSQIAAHLVNAGIEVILFGLPAAAGDFNARTCKAIDRLTTLQPPPLTLEQSARCIVPANYSQHLDKLHSCDLIIEAIRENFDDKEGFYVRIAPYIDKRAIVTSNTCGLSINRLARALPEALRPRFCGMHFFNPPRYRQLVELIAAKGTDPQVLNRLELFLSGSLGKSVVHARDTPYFIAHRIGLMMLTTVLRHAERFGLAPDLADAISMAAFGPDQEAPFELIDRIGSTTFCDLMAGMVRALPDDPWFDNLDLPAWLCIPGENAGVNQEPVTLYRWHAGNREVFDPASGGYRPATPAIAASVQTGLSLEEPADRFIALRANPHPQAQFVWAVLRDVLHYSAFWLNDMAETAEDLDLAMRWGFGWSMGPFETWHAVGWQLVAEWIEEDRKAGKTPAAVALPAWIGSIASAYRAKGSYAPSLHKHQLRSGLSVCQRPPYLTATPGEPPAAPGKTVFAGHTRTIRLWHGSDTHIAILSCQLADQTVPDAALLEMREALSIAEEKFQALIFWNPPPALPFRSPHTRCTPNKTGDTRQAWLKTLAQLEQQAGERQHIYQTLRYLSIPVVGTAAGCVSQFAFELLLHCDRVVAALECRLGFPKLFQGLFPAHGGCLEIARRAARDARHGDIFSLIKFYFDTLINSRTAANAHQARQWGLLTTADAIVLNPDELFHTASIHTQSMLQTGYRPPLREPVAIAGRAAAETLIKNRHTADNCSDRINGWREYHDQIADKLAYVLCGGDAGDCRYIEPGQMLRLEREAFSDIVRILTK